MQPPNKKIKINTKNYQRIILISLVCAFLMAGIFGFTKSARAAFSEFLNYQGKLTDNNSVIVPDGTYNVTFKLYSASGGGEAIWTEELTSSALWAESSTTTVARNSASCGGTGFTKIDYSTATREDTLKAGQYLWNTTLKEAAIITSVDTGNNSVCVANPYSSWADGNDLTNQIYVKSGLFSVMLGSVSSLSSVNFNQTLYLGVTVGDDSEMAPRKVVGAVPAAMEAKKLGGYDWASPAGIGTSAPNTGAFTTLSSNNSTYLVTGSGNVGIGTTSPGYKLDVVGTTASNPALRLTGADTFAGVRMDSAYSVAGNRNWFIGSNALAYGDFTIRQSNAFGGNPITAGTDRLYIKNDGYVGIGTTAPSTTLHVASGGITIGSDYPGWLGDSGIYASGQIYGSSGFITGSESYYNYGQSTVGMKGNSVNSTDDYWLLKTNSTERLRVDGSGNVGIGTASPSQRLSVQSSGTGTDVFQINPSSGSSKFVLRESTSSDIFMRMYNASGSEVVRFDSSSGGYNFFNNGNNLGIGTTAPGVNLDVVSSGDAIIRAITTNDSNYQAALYGSYSWSQPMSLRGYSGHRVIAQALGSENTVLFAGDAEVMRVTTGNTVGIGTTSPSEKLHVAGRILATGSSYVTNPAGPVFGQYSSTIGYAQAPASGEFQIWTDATAAIARFMDSGNAAFTNNVGIGTTAPGAKLDVVGDAYIGAGSIGNSGGGYSNMGYNVGFTSTDNSYTYRYSDTAYMIDYGGYGFLSLSVAAAGTAGNTISFTRALNILNSGNVGIGTTAPARKLFVNGDAGGTGAWNNDSDERLKKNIIGIPNALDRVLALRGVEFEWKDTKYHKAGKQIGFIAQEAKEVVPEVVSKPGEYYGMDYASLTALLAEGMKEQQMMIVEEKTKIENQDGLIEGLENRIETLEEKSLTAEELIEKLKAEGLVLSERISIVENKLDESIKNNDTKINGLSAEIENVKSDMLAINNNSDSNASLDSNVGLTLAGLENEDGLTIEKPVKFKEKSIFASIVEFFGRVIFHEDVQFAGPVTFNNDTAGYAIVSAKEDKIEVKFEHEYEEVPVVNATISVQKISDDELRVATEDLILNSDIKYVVTNVTKSGFEIRMSSSYDWEIPFSWNATAVKDVKTYGKADDDTKESSSEGNVSGEVSGVEDNGEDDSSSAATVESTNVAAPSASGLTDASQPEVAENL